MLCHGFVVVCFLCHVMQQGQTLKRTVHLSIYLFIDLFICLSIYTRHIHLRQSLFNIFFFIERRAEFVGGIIALNIIEET